jgi:hypothetical protein
MAKDFIFDLDSLFWIHHIIIESPHLTGRAAPVSVIQSKSKLLSVLNFQLSS